MTKQITNGGMEENFTAATVATIRMDIDEVSEKLFEKNAPDQEVVVKMLDIPYVIDYDTAMSK